jgi:NADH-quinone oxidoreductase subunit M
VAFFATTGVILSAAYALYLYRRVIFGVLDKPNLMTIADLNWREIATLGPLLLLTLYYGVHPQPILDASAASIDALLQGFNHAVATTKTAGL